MSETGRDHKFTSRDLRHRGAMGPVHIGSVLMLARKIRRLTADEVARRCDVTRGRVYQWEKLKFILPKNLRKLAPALHVPLEMLEAANGSRAPKKRLHCLKKNSSMRPRRWSHGLHA